MFLLFWRRPERICSPRFQSKTTTSEQMVSDTHTSGCSLSTWPSHFGCAYENRPSERNTHTRHEPNRRRTRNWPLPSCCDGFRSLSLRRIAMDIAWSFGDMFSCFISQTFLCPRYEKTQTDRQEWESERSKNEGPEGRSHATCERWGREWNQQIDGCCLPLLIRAGLQLFQSFRSFPPRYVHFCNCLDSALVKTWKRVSARLPRSLCYSSIKAGDRETACSPD
jgi:hypothetical protein